MANINDYIQQIVGAAAGKVEIPDNLKEQVLGGLSSSVLGSLTQTASKAGGLDVLKGFLTGTSDAATSEITALAGNLFNNNVLSKLNLGSLAPVLAGLIPGIMGKLSGFLKDQAEGQFRCLRSPRCCDQHPWRPLRQEKLIFMV